MISQKLQQFDLTIIENLRGSDFTTWRIPLLLGIHNNGAGGDIQSICRRKDSNEAEVGLTGVGIAK